MKYTKSKRTLSVSVYQKKENPVLLKHELQKKHPGCPATIILSTQNKLFKSGFVKSSYLHQFIYTGYPLLV